MNGRQILSSLRWTTLAMFINGLAQIAFLAVLARLLDPASFGLMAMASVTLRFATHFAQAGLAHSLIQKPVLHDHDASTALWMALASGSALYAALLLASPWLAGLFHEPALVKLLQVLGLTLVLGSVAGLPVALLRRQGRFQQLSALEVGSYCVGYGGVGMACAAAGWGVWSLVFATLAQQAMVLVLAMHATRYPLTGPWSRESVAALWAFGSRSSLVGFTEFVFSNLDALVIGRRFGATDLGVFNRAATLSNLPVEQAINALNKVMFPALSSMQTERARLSDTFLLLLLASGVTSMVIACTLSASAHDAVAVLLGPAWAGASPVVAVLSLAVPAMFCYVCCGLTLDSMAALRPKLWLQLAMLVLKALLMFALAAQGLVAIALAVMITEWLRLALGLAVVARVLGLPFQTVLKPMAVVLGVGLLVYAAVWAAAHAAADGPLYLRVACELACAVMAAALCAMGLLMKAPHYGPSRRFETVQRLHRGAMKFMTRKRSA
jgi:lipopolysaccharide exporter